MNTNRWFGWSILLLVFVPLTVMGQFGPKHEMKMNALELTDAQQSQLEEYAIGHKKRMIQAKADLQMAKLDLDNLMLSGSEKEVEKAVDAVAEAHKALLQEKTSHQLQIRKLVGEEKFEQFMQMHGEGHCMSPGKKGKGHHPGKMGQGRQMKHRGMMD